MAERISEEIVADVVAVDISPRMVELARTRGVDARDGDIQAAAEQAPPVNDKMAEGDV
jgi:ubiquinone/menaquinone biosynthesis C-methylase UbiE